MSAVAPVQSPVEPAPPPWRAILRPFRAVGDITTRIDRHEFVRATLTPDGPGTLRITWSGDELHVHSWGPGGGWLEAAAPGLVGALDDGHVFADGHPLVLRAQHEWPGLRLGRSGMLYHELLPTIIGQRVTTGEAGRSYRQLVARLGTPAPGPFPDLRVPPAPERLAAMPTWWFHPLGIEVKRARPLIEVACHADKLWDWARLDAPAAMAQMAMLRGIGEWTIGCVLGTAFGHPDAVAVGDYHLKNLVAFALAGEPRATDERMLELLAPYGGQRGRVVRLLQLGGARPPAFGPRRRVLPMHRW